VPGYSVVSAASHGRSVADLESIERHALVEFVGKIRHALEERFGIGIIAEHGRVPLCLGEAGLSDPHCYHGHFLIFPGVDLDPSVATPFFESHDEFDTLHGALQNAAAYPAEYFLVSDTRDRYLTLKKPRIRIRQFSRRLVAHRLGIAELTDWRIRPDKERAEAMAEELRAIGVGQ